VTCRFEHDGPGRRMRIEVVEIVDGWHPPHAPWWFVVWRGERLVAGGYRQTEAEAQADAALSYKWRTR